MLKIFQGFGKVPNYLLIRKKEAEDIEDRIKEKESKIRPPLRYITEDERQELLEVSCTSYFINIFSQIHWIML